MLKAEGILTIHPRSGIQFVHPGLELTRATYRFRSIIERAAMRVFAKQSEEVLLESLTTRHLSLITKIEAAGLLPVNLPDVDVPERLKHSFVIAIMPSPLIDISYRRMKNHLWLDRKFTTPIIPRTLRDHVEILNACTKHGADAA